MTDILLSSFLSLFALFGKEEQVEEARAKAMLVSYMRHHFGIRNIDSYLDLYSDMRLAYEMAEGLNVQEAVTSICSNLRGKIRSSEASLLLLRLMEFSQPGEQAAAGDEASKSTHPIFHAMADTLGVSDEAFNDYQDFVNARETDHVRLHRLEGFDGIIKKTAKNIGWDWRLLASLIYQESHFRLDLESEKGAFGLMQLMPVVMEKYEIGYDATPEEQLEAGGKLIKYLGECLENKVADSTERVKFVLAAYNAGLGHVYDAQRLAEKYGKYPDVWDNNVDYFILNKSKKQYYNDTCCKAGYLRGTETYRFVEEVLDRYYQYQATYN